MRHIWRLAVVILAALALAGCAIRMNVSSHVERGVDFTQYRTFDWGPADALPTGDPRLDNNPFFHDYLQGAFEKKLAARGFERSASGTTPDLLIHYHAAINERFEVVEVGLERGDCCDGCLPQVINYEQGTLVVDIVDARSNKVIWRGWAQDSVEGVIDDQDRMERQIDEAVTRMLEQFPRVL